jgi:hypothetical protein
MSWGCINGLQGEVSLCSWLHMLSWYKMMSPLVNIAKKCLFYRYVPYNPSFDINVDMPFCSNLNACLISLIMG